MSCAYSTAMASRSARGALRVTRRSRSASAAPIVRPESSRSVASARPISRGEQPGRPVLGRRPAPGERAADPRLVGGEPDVAAQPLHEADPGAPPLITATDGADAIIGIRAVGEVEQLLLDLKGPRVVPLGTIDGQHGDLPVQLVTDERRVVKGPTARP
jgi:hypothetical protein